MYNKKNCKFATNTGDIRIIMTIGERFKYYRQLYELSQEQLAQIMQKETNVRCSKSTISRIENDLSEPSLNYTLAFIKSLSSCPLESTYGDRELSIFSFLSNDINDIDKLEFLNVQILSNAIQNIKKYETKTYEIPLFDVILDVDKPIYKYLFSFDKTKSFLDDLDIHYKKYKQLHYKKQEYDSIINLKKEKYNKQAYEREITKPMKDEVAIIKNLTFDFLKEFLIFYCDPTKKPIK